MLQEKACFNPVKQIKEIINHLERILSTSNNLTNLNEQMFNELTILIKESLFDLICDLDLAADFCKVGGLDVVKKFLCNSSSPNVTSLFLSLISELSQHNPKVQEYFVRDEFYLNYSLNILNVNTDTNQIADDTTKFKALGVISSTVKAYIPGIM